MLHKIRHAMQSHEVAHRLSGIAEMDEAYVGGPGEEPKRGRGTHKTPTLVALSLHPDGKPGYLRMQAVDNVKKETLVQFVEDHVRDDAAIGGDGFGAYRALAEIDARDRPPQRERDRTRPPTACAWLCTPSAPRPHTRRRDSACRPGRRSGPSLGHPCRLRFEHGACEDGFIEPVGVPILDAHVERAVFALEDGDVVLRQCPPLLAYVMPDLFVQGVCKEEVSDVRDGIRHGGLPNVCFHIGSIARMLAKSKRMFLLCRLSGSQRPFAVVPFVRKVCCTDSLLT